MFATPTYYLMPSQPAPRKALPVIRPTAAVVGPAELISGPISATSSPRSVAIPGDVSTVTITGGTGTNISAVPAGLVLRSLFPPRHVRIDLAKLFGARRQLIV
jgi:hypothetical protein